MDKKSPIKDEPLRNPGQSLDERISKIVNEDIVKYCMYPIFFLAVAVIEWVHLFTKSTPSPVIFTVLFIVSVVYSIFKIVKTKKQLKSIRLGRDGEKAVGQYLEILREQGAVVFHDIISNDFNIDHVVISKSGIYVIETKTYSKPAKGTTEITYDGHSISINGMQADCNQVNQVTASSKWLGNLLKESTGKNFCLRPVVLFPGWYIQPTAEAKESDVWVLNPKALPAFIQNSRKQMEKEDVKLASYHLSRYVRTFDKSLKKT